jgi:K+-sensing histidine kinase KdpD
MVVIGNAINAWALELFRQKTNSDPKAAPDTDRKKRDKAKQKRGTETAFWLMMGSMIWMVVFLADMLIDHAKDPVNVLMVFIIASSIAAILFGAISIYQYNGWKINRPFVNFV